MSKKLPSALLTTSLIFFFFLSCSLLAVPISTSTATLNYKISKKMDGSSGHWKKSVEFQTENFPLNTPLIFAYNQLNGKGNFWNVKINEKGQLVKCGNKDADQIFVLNLSGFTIGEPINCLLSSKDKKITASVTIIPFPIEVKDQNGHLLSLQIAGMDNETFYMIATGFNSFETVELISTSGSEVIRHNVKMDQEGKIQSMLFPAVIGEKSGDASIEIKGKTTDHLKVNYHWGF